MVSRLLSFVLLLMVVQRIVAQQDSPVLSDTTAAQIEPVALIDIPSKAEGLIRNLGTEALPVIQRPFVSNQRVLVDSLQDTIQSLRQLSDLVLDGDMPAFLTGTAIARWQRFRQSLNQLEARLKRYAGQLTELKTSLNREEQKWQLTKDTAARQEAPEEIIGRIDRLLFRVDSVKMTLSDSLSGSLNLQNELVDIKLTLDAYIEQLNDYQTQTIEELSTKRSAALWEIDSLVDTTGADSLGLELLWTYGKEDTREFLKDEQEKLILVGFIFLLLLLLLLWMRNRYKELQEKEIEVEELELGKYIFSRPLFAALLFTLIIQSWIIPEKPYLLTQMVNLVMVVLFVALIPGLIPRSMRWTIYFLAGVYLLGTFDQIFTIFPGMLRSVYLLESLAMIGFLWWFFRHRQRLRPRTRSEFLWFGFLSKAGPVFLLFFLAAVVGNVLGYVTLTHFINKNTLGALLIWLLLGAAYRITEGLAYLFLETDFAQGAYLVQKRKEEIFNLITTVFRLGTIFLWTYYTLVLFMLWDPFLEAAGDILEIGYQFGAINITIGGILSFFLILLLSWSVANLIKVLLEDEILSRFKLARGVPMAIASLTNYTLITIGFFLALASAGFDLANIGLLAGALGVGIGFGLQNIVSNFISGLILIFERPITVGDTIEVEGIIGTVSAIGIRSSRIRQFNGDEEIIPNATFISGRVTNRTLSDSQRRYIIRINTSLEADPQQVLGLLEETCRSVEDVLRYPPPRAYFEGIVDQSMQFSLYYWLSSNILDANSLANLKVHEALRAAGIQFRVPRQLEVTTVDGKDGTSRTGADYWTGRKPRPVKRPTVRGRFHKKVNRAQSNASSRGSKPEEPAPEEGWTQPEEESTEK